VSANNGSQSGQPPRLLGERYEVVEIVGAGASAVTWRGFDRRLERPVAIKILRRGGHQDDPAWLQRFEREARLAASVSDPHVVQVFDVGQEDGWPYLVMQYIEGQDLKDLINERGPLPPARASDIALQILDGLASIHHTGILHRDIKPQNVLLDRQGRVRVTDFGIAQGAFDLGLTSDGMALGTASYMAPEQARGGTLSEATDIYAVGVVLFEMLTGRTPFERSTPMATMLAHIEDEPTPPSLVAPGQGVSPRLDGIVLQAMAKEPGQRFRSATAMARAIEGVTAVSTSTATTRLPSATPEEDVTRLAPRQSGQGVNVRPPQRTPPPPPATTSPGRQGGGGRGPLTFLLVLILLAMVAVAAYLGNELINRNEGGGSPTSTATVAPSPTATPEETEEIIVPPTDEPVEPSPTPTLEPTNEPLPTATPEPTAEPTDEPPPATQGPPIIVPVETLPPTEQPIIEPSN
jgi:serine/threonine-protein kinase